MSNIHDLIFFIGTVILIWGPFKMVRARVTPPVSATLLTALPLTAFMINYGTMNYWWSALAQAIQTSLWAILVYRGVRRRKEMHLLDLKDAKTEKEFLHQLRLRGVPLHDS